MRQRGIVICHLSIVIGQVHRIAIALASLLVLPTVADAHLVTTGLGPVYDGIGHLLLTPQDLIAVLALCLLAGLRGTEHSRKVLFVLPVVWFAAGNLVGTYFEGFGAFPFAAISFIVLGLLVATDVKITPLGIGMLAIVLGAVHGYDNGVALDQNAGAMGLLGIMTALFVVIAISTATVVSLKKPWMRIVVRVLGSWVVATGIMMLGWHYRLEKRVNTTGAPTLAVYGQYPDVNATPSARWTSTAEFQSSTSRACSACREPCPWNSTNAADKTKSNCWLR